LLRLLLLLLLLLWLLPGVLLLPPLACAIFKGGSIRKLLKQKTKCGGLPLSKGPVGLSITVPGVGLPKGTCRRRAHGGRW